MDRELLIQLCDEYTLGLLEGDERTQLEELLRSGDPEARAQLRRAEEFVAQLALLSPAAAPPAALRARVVAPAPPAASPVVSIEAGAPPRPVARPRSWAAGWAAAAALAVASAYSYFAIRSLRSELDQTRTQLAAVRGEADRSRQALKVIFSRDSRFIRLSTSEQAPTFRAFWSGPGGGLVLAGSNVPAPAQGRTLQLWVVPKQGNPISAGIFAPGANGQVLLIAASPAEARLENAAALAISDEPAGGSAQPTTKPAFVGTLGD